MLNKCMTAIIYKITNQITNKSYIGWTGQPLETRWVQHQKLALKDQDNRPFYNAIRKYGTDCWTTEVLATTEDKTVAKQKEIEYIQLFESYDHGYNATRGGDGNNDIKMSEESNQSRSKALKGRPKNYIRMAGKKQSEESRKKISEAHKGMKKPWVKWSKEQIAKRSFGRRALTEQQYNQIHLLKNQGLRICDIAKQVETTPDLVKKWLNKSWNLS
jgi:group I intron endonuclease